MKMKTNTTPGYKGKSEYIEAYRKITLLFT